MFLRVLLTACVHRLCTFFCSLGCVVISTSASDCLERLLSEMSCYVPSETLNTHLLTLHDEL